LGVANIVGDVGVFEEGEVADPDGVAANDGGDALAGDGGDIGCRWDGVAVEAGFDAGGDGSGDGVVALPFDGQGDREQVLFDRCVSAGSTLW
jgi:hypothetical protein